MNKLDAETLDEMICEAEDLESELKKTDEKHTDPFGPMLKWGDFRILAIQTVFWGEYE